MKRRIIGQMRLSRKWTEHSAVPAGMLAAFIYALYTFIGLNDPYSEVGWVIGYETKTKAPYLLVYEEVPESEEEELETDLSSGPELNVDSSDDTLDETDINPDIIEED